MNEPTVKSAPPDRQHEGDGRHNHAVLVGNLKRASVYRFSPRYTTGQNLPSRCDRFLPRDGYRFKNTAFQVSAKVDDRPDVEEKSRHKLWSNLAAKTIMCVVGGSGWFGPRRNHFALNRKPLKLFHSSRSTLSHDPGERKQGDAHDKDDDAAPYTSQNMAGKRVQGHDDAPFSIGGGSALTLSDSARAKSHRSGHVTPLPGDVESPVVLSAPTKSKGDNHG